MQLAKEKLQEINTLKATQAEMQGKAAVDITDLKKAQDRLIVEQAQLCVWYSELEQAISVACQDMVDTPTELTPVAKAQQLGQTLIQLQDHNLLLQAQAQPTTPPE